MGTFPPLRTRHRLASADPMGEPDDMHRRELLRLLSVGPPSRWPCPARPVPPAVAGWRAADIDQYTALNAHLWQVFGISRTKRLAYPLVRDQLAVLTAELGRGLPEAMRRQLCALACDLFQLAGEIAFDGNRYTDAAHCYALAATAGREAGTSDRWACALTRQAFISMSDKRHGRGGGDPVRRCPAGPQWQHPAVHPALGRRRPGAGICPPGRPAGKRARTRCRKWRA